MGVVKRKQINEWNIRDEINKRSKIRATSRSVESKGMPERMKEVKKEAIGGFLVFKKILPST